MDSIDYGSLFMLLPGPHMVMRADDPDFTLIAENEAHARLINPDELIYSVGKPFLTAYPDTSDEYQKTGQSTVVESMRRVVKTGLPDSMPDIRYDLVDRRGVYVERWWRATHYPIKDVQGKVIQVLQLTQDITSELSARRERDRTAAQLNLALEAGLVSSFTWNIQKDIVTGDRNLAKMFGVTPADAAKGLPIDTFISSIHADDRERVGSAIEQTVANGVEYDIEYRTVTRRGVMNWVIARGAVERDEAGTPLTFVGILIDTTARKKVEEALETSKRMFDTLFSSTMLSIAQAEQDGTILLANKTFLKTFGYTQADVDRGLGSRDLTPLGSRQVTKQIYDAVDTLGEAQPVEKEYVRKDGSTFTGLVGAVRVPGTHQLIAFILDVSENHRLKEVNAAKDEFIALASHQLRTPATAVKQYLGLILEGFAGDIDETQRGYLQTANDSNNRELQIINDLLKTAQLDTNGYKLKPKQADLITLISDIVKDYASVCEMKNQKIEFTHDGPVKAAIDVDETKIVITNLIENAHKYSHAGTTIHVNAQKNGKFAKIVIKDEGVGIAKADLTAIFEKFTRIDNPLSDSVTGNGLGLYWVKRIITLHGGALDVDSQISKGTTFTIQLPL